MSALSAHFAARGTTLLTLEGGSAVPASFGDPAGEHLAARGACALFDFSFMGAWEVLGRDAAAHLARLQTRDLGSLVPGQAAYTLLLREDGTVFNDATVWMFSPERYWVFTGRPGDAAWIAADAGDSEVVIPPSGVSLAVLALQGPSSGAVLAKLAGSDAVRALGYFRFAEMDLLGEPALVARLGYSGELGYEILVDETRAVAAWEALLAAGGAYGIREAGFEAADSLRIECGHVLFSRELARPRLPVALGLVRLVTSTDPAMRGGEALQAASDAPTSRLVCVEIAGEAPSGAPALELTSEADSPSFGVRLGLGFAPAAHDRRGTVLADARGRACVVTGLPRYDPDRRRPRESPLP